MTRTSFPRFQLGFLLVICLASVSFALDDKTKLALRLEREADAHVQKVVEEHNFSGVVLIAKDGIPLVRKAYGFADWIKRVPNTPQTRFMLFSTTKQFTAAAIMRLADREKLSVEDPVSKYIEHWPKEWGAVRIHHLLTHSSGIDIDTFAFWMFEFYPHFWPEPSEKPPSYVPKSLLNRPGTFFRYSNVGYTVLSIIIEKVTGKPFREAMKNEVFIPLKLERTGFEGERPFPPRARGHDLSAEAIEYREQKTIDIVGAGDLITNVDDLLKWDEALYGNSFLSAQALQSMFKSYLPGMHSGGAGYGWVVRKGDDGISRFQFNGNGAGFRSYVFRRPHIHLYVAVLANAGYQSLLPYVEDLTDTAESILTD